MFIIICWCSCCSPSTLSFPYRQQPQCKPLYGVYTGQTSNALRQETVKPLIVAAVNNQDSFQPDRRFVNMIPQNTPTEFSAVIQCCATHITGWVVSKVGPLLSGDTCQEASTMTGTPQISRTASYRKTAGGW